MHEFPSAGVVGGEILVQVLRHSHIEFIALFEVCRAEAVVSGGAMSLAIDVVVFCGVVILLDAGLGDMGAAANITYVCDFFCNLLLCGSHGLHGI